MIQTDVSSAITAQQTPPQHTLCRTVYVYVQTHTHTHSHIKHHNGPNTYPHIPHTQRSKLDAERTVLLSVARLSCYTQSSPQWQQQQPYAVRAHTTTTHRKQPTVERTTKRMYTRCSHKTARVYTQARAACAHTQTELRYRYI